MEKKSKATRALKSLPMKAADSVAVRGGGKKKADPPVKFMVTS
jgi:hypothetical protein